MKKILALLTALVMVFALCACGGSTTPSDSAPADTSASAEPTPEPAPAPAEETPAGPSFADVAGTYTFVAVEDMGNMVWTLTLNDDGTYTAAQQNPWGEKTAGDGTYTIAADGTIECSGVASADLHAAEDGVPFMDKFLGSEYVGDDNSTSWTLNDDGTAVPVGYTGTIGSIDDVANTEGPGGNDVYGDYTYVEQSDMCESTWTLSIHPDGTYTLRQDNPFDDKTAGDGEYTMDGNVVSCGPVDSADFYAAEDDAKFADRFMGGFVGDDNSSTWVINSTDMTMEPQE